MSPVIVTGREWTIDLPPGTTFLTANHRENRWTANSITKNLKTVVATLAKIQRIPCLERAEIVVEYENPPRLRKDRAFRASPRIEDQDNLAPAAKAIVDGLVKFAGILPSDSRAYCTSRLALLDTTNPCGHLRVIVREVRRG